MIETILLITFAIGLGLTIFGNIMMPRPGQGGSDDGDGIKLFLAGIVIVVLSIIVMMIYGYVTRGV